MGIINSEIVYNGLNHFLDIFGELKGAKKYGKSLKIRAEVMDNEHNKATTYPALIDTTYMLLYIPLLNAIWFYPHIRPLDGKDTAYVSLKNHYALDLNKLSSIAEAQRYNALLSFRYMRNFVSVKLENVTGGIDFSVFDNQGSGDFSIDSSKIIKTKAFEFMQEVQRNKLIMYCTITGLAGIILGFIIEILGLSVLMRWL